MVTIKKIPTDQINPIEIHKNLMKKDIIYHKKPAKKLFMQNPIFYLKDTHNHLM
jgi:hypothetical protein